MCMCWHMNFKVNLKTALYLLKLVIRRIGNYCRDNVHTLMFLSLLAFHITLCSRQLIYSTPHSFAHFPLPNPHTKHLFLMKVFFFFFYSFISVYREADRERRSSCRHTACCDFMVILLKHLFVWRLSGVRLQSFILSGFYHSSASPSLPLQVILRHLPPLRLNV